jgi:plastocyanin
MRRKQTTPEGSPPVPEQAGQNPQSADRMAVAASRAEIAAGGGTIGVEGNGTANSGASAPNSNASAGSAARGSTVRMQENHYTPANITIRAGQTVTWTNTTQSPHTVVLSPEAATNPADVKMPKDAQPFDSGNIPPGGSFSHTFSVPGTYKYFCSLHEGDGMVGNVVVRPR